MHIFPANYGCADVTGILGIHEYLITKHDKKQQCLDLLGKGVYWILTFWLVISYKICISRQSNIPG